jgi:succinoglycan biosynthesis transport protein ExoP
MSSNAMAGGVSPAALFRALRRRKLYVLLPVLVLTPAIVFYALRLPPTFRARALVGTAPAISARPDFAKPDTLVTLTAEDQLRAIRETLLSTSVIESVIREFRLYDLPTGRASVAVIEAMKTRIEIQVEGPEAFYVGFEGSRPDQAMNVANRLAGLFLDRKSDLRGRRVSAENTFLDSEVGPLQTQLKGEEDKLRAYQQSAAGALPERMTANLKQLETLPQQIQAKNDQITEGEARRLALTDEVKGLANQGALEAEPPAKTTSEINLEQLHVKLNELRTKYTPEHPEIQRAEKQIQDLEAVKVPAPVVKSQPSAVQQHYLALQSELKSIDPRLQTYRRERDDLTVEMQTYEQRINAAPGFETTLAERSREAALTRTRYEALLAKQQQAKLSDHAEKTDSDSAYKIIEPAQAPTVPSGPHRVRIILGGFLGSLLVGLLAGFFAERSNPSFETTEELESFTSLPVLSSVPTITTLKTQKKFGTKSDSPNSMSPVWLTEKLSGEQQQHVEAHRLPTLGDPQSVAAQQYSILALKIQQWMARTGGKTLLVTSSSSEEGKSLTALNLGLALAAASEARILLVDADLRLPSVGQRLGLGTKRGLSDLLAFDGGDMNSYVSKIGSLHVLPGGPCPANPVGLLASGRTQEILAGMRNDFDLVILDSPPIVPIADSHILAGLCDGVMLVVRARKTRPELLLRAIESLGASNMIGFVLNDVELSATPYAYAYRYYQRHYLGRS